MPKIVPIVEGPGETDAVPELLRKILRSYHRDDIRIAHVKNAHGVGSLTIAGGLERYLQYAFNEPDSAGVLVLRDADDQCPRTMAKGFANRAIALNPPIPIAIVVAKCEYEAWFLVSLETIAGMELDGRPGILADAICENPEEIGDAKGWITRSLPGSRAYKETLDQLAMTRFLDIGQAHRRSRSFRRMCKAVVELCNAIDAGSIVVTPVI